MDPFFRTGLSISDSLKSVRKSVLIYETIIIHSYQHIFLHLMLPETHHFLDLQNCPLSLTSIRFYMDNRLLHFLFIIALFF